MIDRSMLPEQVRSMIISFEHEGCIIKDEIIEDIIRICCGAEMDCNSIEDLVKKYKQNGSNET